MNEYALIFAPIKFSDKKHLKIYAIIVNVSEIEIINGEINFDSVFEIFDKAGKYKSDEVSEISLDYLGTHNFKYFDKHDFFDWEFDLYAPDFDVKILEIINKLYNWKEQTEKSTFWTNPQNDWANPYHRLDRIGFAQDLFPENKIKLLRTMKDARETLLNSRRLSSINNEIAHDEDGKIILSKTLQDTLQLPEWVEKKKDINSALRFIKTNDDGYIFFEKPETAADFEDAKKIRTNMWNWYDETAKSSPELIALGYFAKGGKVKWNDVITSYHEKIGKGLKSESGFGDGERKAMRALLNEKTGLTPAKIAEFIETETGEYNISAVVDATRVYSPSGAIHALEQIYLAARNGDKDTTIETPETKYNFNDPFEKDDFTAYATYAEQEPNYQDDAEFEWNNPIPADETPF
ncbi:MAG: hypothetical protein LBN95_13700 [Prevotellaceae bacterium]|jgi:hypothetical protein|nr:hypothetical protein [Prevotellaceae bacterium]